MENQQRMIKLYRNKIRLLDATYKTTKHAIPLFFVALKTNVDYQVVPSFALQDETTSANKEGLLILVSWIPLWQPKCFMVDNCEEERNSIGHVFQSKSNNGCFRFTRRLLCLQFGKAYLLKLIKEYYFFFIIKVIKHCAQWDCFRCVNTLIFLSSWKNIGIIFFSLNVLMKFYTNYRFGKTKGSIVCERSNIQLLPLFLFAPVVTKKWRC